MTTAFIWSKLTRSLYYLFSPQNGSLYSYRSPSFPSPTHIYLHHSLGDLTLYIQNEKFHIHSYQRTKPCFSPPMPLLSHQPASSLKIPHVFLEFSLEHSRCSVHKCKASSFLGLKRIFQFIRNKFHLCYRRSSRLHLTPSNSNHFIYIFPIPTLWLVH